MAGGTSQEVKPKRVPGKRTATTPARRAAAGSSRVPRKRASRARATRAEKESKPTSVTQKKEQPVEEKKTPSRKAPTAIAGDKKQIIKARIHTAVTSFIVLCGVLGSALIGYSDKGSIDVNGVIETRNEKVRASGSGDLIIPVQNTSQEPDGGLIGFGIGTQKPTSTPAVEESSSTSTATSSEEALDENETQGQIPLSAEEATQASQRETATTSEDS